MTIDVPAWVGELADELAYPLIFATVSGAHLYGFASVDSDVDLRAVHVLPAAEVVGLRTGPETLDRAGVRDGVETDVVSHDLAMFCRLLLRPNGAVLEQLESPLVVRTSVVHARLRALVPAVVTRNHARHYLGFAQTQWGLFQRTDQLKPALYTVRVLLTGVHLMRTGLVEADLRRLYPDFDLPYVPELIAAKREGEHRPWTGVERGVLEADVARLTSLLERSAAESALPEAATAHDALHELLVERRLATTAATAAAPVT